MERKVQQGGGGTLVSSVVTDQMVVRRGRGRNLGDFEFYD